ncbi:DMT family transporter [Marinobacter oulmenensis]|uniref:Small multidrug resistance pump n=1 Tax=Marinobacter oulmenensis TaxID=643747 RepID=A0A840U583_9GAMM|nr:SMR family transporter [Marinobacter oulmenensis]MBB5320299.1 small multidrug resistance pump [Marinobacter oulmenensis]
MSWMYLMVAIVAEVVGTTALKASDGFTRLGPTLMVIVGYAVAFYFLSLAIRVIPVGLAYAAWAGLGIVLISLIGWLAMGQRLDFPAIAGMLLIVAGVLVINLFSNTSAH